MSGNGATGANGLYDFSDWGFSAEDEANSSPEMREFARRALKVAFQGFGGGSWTLSGDRLLWIPDIEMFSDEPWPAYITFDPNLLTEIFMRHSLRDISV